MPDSRDPIGIRRAVLVPSQGNGTCAVCLHAYDEHWIRFDGGLQQCTGTDVDGGPVCECLEYVPS
jgi:hypothetical protein